VESWWHFLDRHFLEGTSRQPATIASLTGNKAFSITTGAGAREADHTRTLDRVIHADWYLLNVYIAGGFSCCWTKQSSP